MQLDWSDMPIHEAIKADWTTPEILIEGSLNSAKTTVFLDKEIDALLKWPGIPILLFRWSQDAVDTKLKPAFDELLSLRGLTATWDSKEKAYVFPNESKAYIFGLKSVSLIEMYNKIRGLGVSRIGGDQVEEVAQAIGSELRARLRPNLTATLTNRNFPFQLTFVANPEDYEFWLSKEFPEDGHIKGRRLFSLSVFDNKHLPRESIDSLLRTFPPEHPKHTTMVLGRRGPNITGVPVFEGLYRRDLHHRAVQANAMSVFVDAFEVGKHNPTYVLAEVRYSGGLTLWGGLRGQEIMLEDFLPIVQDYRARWLPPMAHPLACMGPMGETIASRQGRITAVNILRDAGFAVRYRETGNAPDVRLAMIEAIGGYLRRRTPNGDESLLVNNDDGCWFIAAREGLKPSPFMHIAFEAGYTWDPHFVSVSNKEVRQPREDDKFANAMHCVEHIMLNFCAGQRTQAEKAQRRQRARQPSGPPQPGTSLDYMR